MHGTHNVKRKTSPEMSAGRKASRAFPVLLFILFLLVILLVYTFAIIIFFLGVGYIQMVLLFLRTLWRRVISCTSIAKCEVFKIVNCFLGLTSHTASVSSPDLPEMWICQQILAHVCPAGHALFNVDRRAHMNRIADAILSETRLKPYKVCERGVS